MLPKSSKHYIIPTAEELDLSEGIVQDITSFFYSELRDTLVNMRFHNIQVDNLGRFEAIQEKVYALTKKYEKHLENTTGETYSQMAIKKDTESKLEKARSLHKLIMQDRQRKKEFLKNKYGN